MTDSGTPDSRNRRGTVALVVAVVLAVVGGTSIAWAVHAQRHAPQPGAAQAGRIDLDPSTAATPTAGSPATAGTPTTTAPAASTTATASPPTTPTTTTTPATSASAAPPPQPLAMPASVPTSIAIPAIHVTSDLQRLGLNPDGTLEVPRPPHYNEAGWFTHSPTPGEVGPAVIEGHVDSAADGPSVFFRLGALKPGDHIQVRRSDRSTAIFMVTAVRSYPKDAFPTTVVYGGTHTAQLRLITCGGSFDHSTGHYRNNIVVYADLTQAVPAR